MKKILWTDWLVFAIVCRQCYDDQADQQWLGSNGYQLTPQDKADQWRLAGEQYRNARTCESCGKPVTLHAAAA